jgi:hypothetical protein
VSPASLGLQVRTFVAHSVSPPTRQLLMGLMSFLRPTAPGTGGSCSAEYCYSVYLRHLVSARSSGLQVDPEVVAEIGPGDSLGVGLMALLCGASRYYAFDAVEHASAARNLAVFDRLFVLLSDRSPIPADGEFSGLLPSLDNYHFPADILDEARLRRALDPGRVQALRRALQGGRLLAADGPVRYFAPWQSGPDACIGGVDVVISQAAMEHVDDLEEGYRACRKWLRKGGWVSHQVDFRSHETAREWNGHWGHSDLSWALIRGKRPWLLNRQPFSEHVRLLVRSGFRISNTQVTVRGEGIRRADLARRFRGMSDDDLSTASALIQATMDDAGPDTERR